MAGPAPLVCPLLPAAAKFHLSASPRPAPPRPAVNKKVQQSKKVKMFKLLVLLAVWVSPTAGQTPTASAAAGGGTSRGYSATSSSSSSGSSQGFPFQPVAGSTVSGGGCVGVRAGDVAGVAGSFTPAGGLAGYRIDVYARNVSCPAVWSGAQIADDDTYMVILLTTLVMISPTEYCGLAVGEDPKEAQGFRDRYNGTHALVRTDDSAIKLGCDANCERCMTSRTIHTSESVPAPPFLKPLLDALIRCDVGRIYTTGGLPSTYPE